MTKTHFLNRKKLSALHPKRQKPPKRTLVATLMLTSLIDAFAILVIYLLINFGNPTELLQASQRFDLPQAMHHDELTQGTVVGIKNGRYFYADKEVSLLELVRKLRDTRHDEHLIIQADKDTRYTSLSPLITAGSQAGFKEFKFAIFPEASPQ